MAICLPSIDVIVGYMFTIHWRNCWLYVYHECKTVSMNILSSCYGSVHMYLSLEQRHLFYQLKIANIFNISAKVIAHDRKLLNCNSLWMWKCSFYRLFTLNWFWKRQQVTKSLFHKRVMYSKTCFRKLICLSFYSDMGW